MLFVLLGVAVALGLLLWVLPLDLSVQVERRATHRYAFELRAALGSLGHTWSGPSTSRRAPARKRRPKRRRAARRVRGREVLHSVTSRAFVNALHALGRRSVRAVRFGGGSLVLQLGLDDPAETAHLCGVLFALAPVARAHGVAVDLRPDFEREICAFVLAARVRIHLLNLACAVSAFLFTPAVWRAARAAVGRKATSARDRFSLAKRPTAAV